MLLSAGIAIILISMVMVRRIPAHHHPFPKQQTFHHQPAITSGQIHGILAGCLELALENRNTIGFVLRDVASTSLGYP